MGVTQYSFVSVLIFYWNQRLTIVCMHY